MRQKTEMQLRRDSQHNDDTTKLVIPVTATVAGIFQYKQRK